MGITWSAEEVSQARDTQAHQGPDSNPISDNDALLDRIRRAGKEGSRPVGRTRWARRDEGVRSHPGIAQHRTTFRRHCWTSPFHQRRTRTSCHATKNPIWSRP